VIAAIRGRATRKPTPPLLDYLSRELDALRTLVEHYLTLELAQARLDATFVEFVHRCTEGHPFFVTDPVKHLREQDVLSDTGGEWHLTRNVDAIGRDLPEFGMQSH
jgi:hypothetical protein